MSEYYMSAYYRFTEFIEVVKDKSSRYGTANLNTVMVSLQDVVAAHSLEYCDEHVYKLTMASGLVIYIKRNEASTKLIAECKRNAPKEGKIPV